MKMPPRKKQNFLKINIYEIAFKLSDKFLWLTLIKTLNFPTTGQLNTPWPRATIAKISVYTSGSQHLVVCDPQNRKQNGRTQFGDSYIVHKIGMGRPKVSVSDPKEGPVEKC